MMTDAVKPEASMLQRLADHLFFPLNMWLAADTSLRLGLTPIDHERIRAALPHCRGRLLDIGCGSNLLVRSYGGGIGVDIHPYPEIDTRCPSDALPFRENTFDTVALLACLNHILRREETLRECRRVLRPGGLILISMIPQWVGLFCHKIRERHDPDQLERGMAEDEDWGLSAGEVRALLEKGGFRRVKRFRFMWGLNSLFVAEAS